MSWRSTLQRVSRFWGGRISTPIKKRTIVSRNRTLRNPGLVQSVAFIRRIFHGDTFRKAQSTYRHRASFDPSRVSKDSNTSWLRKHQHSKRATSSRLRESWRREDPVHERTLFIVATLFAMYLQVSEWFIDSASGGGCCSAPSICAASRQYRYLGSRARRTLRVRLRPAIQTIRVGTGRANDS
ncbi:hypothetical protein FQZ97_595490 [compost metagenome]